MEAIKEMIRPLLFGHVVRNVWPVYELNDGAHDLDHIKAVITRAMELNENLSLHQDVEEIFVSASYHDICCHIDRQTHEVLSAEYFKGDSSVQRFFNPESAQAIYDAIRDHRASAEGDPQSDLGRLLSSADRPTTIDQVLRRHWKHHFTPRECSLDAMAEECLAHCKRRYGQDGHARKKVYFDDGKYANFLVEMQSLTSNTNAFKAKYRDVNLDGIDEEVSANSLFVKELRLLLTQYCNYDCVFCHREGVNNVQPSLLTLDDYLFLYDACQAHFGWSSVTLSGGEPMLYPHFDELVSALATRGCRIAVVTNGEFLHKHLDSIKLLKRINISVPSFSADTYHAKVGRINKFAKVMKNIELVRTAAPKLGCRINMVLTKGNEEDWLVAAEFARQYGCGIKFIELSTDDPGEKATMDDAVEVLTQAGAIRGSELDDRRILMKSREELDKEDILLTRFICDHAGRAANPGEACYQMLDLFLTPSGNVNTCAVTSSQESLLDAIKERDSEVLVTRIRDINSRIGSGCILPPR